MNRDADEVLEHEYFVHNICNQCPKCQLVLPYTFMTFHMKAKCNDYLGAEVYCQEREKRRSSKKETNNADIQKAINKKIAQKLLI